ncbi:hypothetical protein CTAYLR_005446 [Chrysophaeum taylorii]|uniref:Protein ENHANCED DISEASE RESISTANCE 2 C-terminal domain-containing protein n=1 Tax=Chrysophaeum taylorii TaxID=2483200 RepID=A0AAD7UJR7_9STRA|nr:hypothetical protein CTAYLR_005446 [Chrysophaeum taylorii]
MVRESYFDRMFLRRRGAPHRPASSSSKAAPPEQHSQHSKQQQQHSAPAPSSASKTTSPGEVNEVPEEVLRKRAAELVEYRRRQYSRRWRLYDVSLDGIRVFVEEKKATHEEDARLEARSFVGIGACWVLLAVGALWWVGAFCCGLWLAVGVPVVWFIVGVPRRGRTIFRDIKRAWRLSGRVRAVCAVDASAEEVFRLVQGSVKSREADWSLEYEDGRLVEAVDGHTDVVEVMEKVNTMRVAASVLDFETRGGGLSAIFRKVLAFHARSSRLMRYWREDDDGGYTVVSQSVEANASFQSYTECRGCNVILQDHKGSMIEIRPAHGDRRGVVVTESADVDAKLSWFSALYCWGDPPAWLRVADDSPVAVAFHATRLRRRLRGLRACATQLYDDDPAVGRANKSLSIVTNELYRGDELSPRHNRHRAAANNNNHHNAGPPKPLPPPPPPPLLKSSSSYRGHVATPTDDESATKAVVAHHQRHPHAPTDEESTTSLDSIGSAPSSSTVSAAPPKELKELFCFLSPNFHRATAPYETNAWDELPPEHFNVRGPHYLEDGKKIPAPSKACRLVNVGTLRSERPLDNLVNRSDHGVDDTHDAIVINFMLPHDGHNYVSFLFYFIDNKTDKAFSKRLHHFATEMTDAQRNEHFKLIPFIQDGPWVARHALGMKPAIIGRAIRTAYHIREPARPGAGRVVEIDVDVGSSGTANAVWRIMRGVAKALVVDLAFLFESKLQADLPETLFGTARVYHFDFATHDNPAVTVVPPPNLRTASDNAVLKRQHSDAASSANVASPAAHHHHPNSRLRQHGARI